MGAIPNRGIDVIAATERGTGESEEALLAPLPGPDFPTLDWRQSVIGWWLGLALGTLVAAAVIFAIATGLA